MQRSTDMNLVLLSLGRTGGTPVLGEDHHAISADADLPVQVRYQPTVSHRSNLIANLPIYPVC